LPPLDLHNQIEQFADLASDGRIGKVDSRLQNAMGETGERIDSGVGVNGRDRTAMSRIERLQQVKSFAAPHFTDNDPVGPVAKACPDEIADRHLGKIGTGAPRLEPDKVGLAKPNLRRVFNKDDPLLIRNCTQQRAQKRGLARPSSPADEKVLLLLPTPMAGSASRCRLLRSLSSKAKSLPSTFRPPANPGLARLIGTLMKVDFQRAVLSRIPKMEACPEADYRQVLFLCDDYHAFATVGESDPTGDEKFFSLSRQARCIPIVATQSISSLRSALSGETWRTLLQTFRTKIFLALSDNFSAREASDLCGRDEQLKLSYNFSENGQDARVSMLTGRATAQRATITASKNDNLQRDNIFEARVFAELKNAQAIVLAYDGFNPLPATYCYLKPYYLDPTVSYFEHLRRGAL
jgi:hypothetical protein